MKPHAVLKSMGFKINHKKVLRIMHKNNILAKIRRKKIKFSDKTLYLSAIMDGFNGEIVAYKITDNQEVPLVKDTLSEAIVSIKYKDLILHSDQDAIYICPNFQNFVKQNGITMSMSRKGNCHDNADMESFFSSLKTEVFYSQGLKNLSSKMVIEIVSQYIDYYNKERIQAKLNYLSPVKYKKKVA